MAGLFIAQSAGCLIGDFSGKPDTYDSDHMIVSSPKCFKDLNKCVADGYQSKEQDSSGSFLTTSMSFFVRFVLRRTLTTI